MTAAPAPGSGQGAVRPDSPFVGLVPFDEEDAPFFFGRGLQTGIVAANLRSTRLTILYGPSGVGKSSLLMAGAVHELRQEARSAAGESPFAVCVFRSWRGDPVRGVEAAARTALAPLGETGPPEATLAETLRSWTEGTGTLLVVLDQFEEYFQYHPGEDDGERLTGFAAEVTRLVNDPSLAVHVLLSIREDALARLDRFEGHIPSLFSNYLRVEHLDRAEARRAVEGPVSAWNRLLADGEAPYEIEAALVDEVIDAAVGGRLVFAADGDAVEAEAARDRVEAPFLQLVLERLWRDAVERGDRRLTLARLEELGGARRIVENHLLDALGRLTPAEQAVAADAFRFLVTRSKTKIAHPASDLADWTGRPEPEVKAVLDRLAGAESGRILRAVAPAGDDGRGEGYELFHDVLAEPILDWRRAYEQDRERLRVRRRFLRIGGTLLALVAVFAALGVWALVQRHDANRSAEATKWLSVAVGARDLVDDRLPEALLLGLEANKHSDSEEARNAMTLALETAHQSGVSANLLTASGAANAVAFSPDGSLVASGDSRGDVTLARADGKGVPAHVEAGGSGPISGVAFSPDGQTLAFGGGDGAVRLLDVRRRTVSSTLRGHEDEVTSVAFSADGRTLASGSYDGTVLLWSVADGRRIGIRTLTRVQRGSAIRIAVRYAVLGVSFSPDGRMLAMVGAGQSGGSVQLWDAHTGRPVFFAHEPSPVDGVAFSADGRAFATAGSDGTVAIWDVRPSRDPRKRINGPRGSIFTSVAVSHAGTVAAATTDGTIWLWRLDTGKAVGSPLRADASSVRALAFSPNGRTLATGGAAVRLWALAGHRELGAPLNGLRTGTYYSVAVSRSGLLAALDRTGSVHFWNLERNSPAGLRVRATGLLSVAFTRDGHLATGGADGNVRVWDVETGKQVDSISIGPDPVLGLAISADGRILAAARRKDDVSLWDLRSHEQLERLLDPGAKLGSVAIAPDGHTVAAGSENGVVDLFDLRDHALVRAVQTNQRYVYGVAFSPDGRVLVTVGQDGSLSLWDAATLKPLGMPLIPAPARPRPLTGVAFRPDGRTIATVSLDGRALLWRGIVWPDTTDLEEQVCSLVKGSLVWNGWREEWRNLAPGLKYRASCTR